MMAESDRYDLIHSIFNETFVRVYHQFANEEAPDLYSILVNDVTTLITQSNITRLIEELITRDVHELTTMKQDDASSLTSKITVKSKEASSIIRLILSINDIMCSINTVLSFETALSKLLFDGVDISLKRSDEHPIYRGLSIPERIICLFHILIDIVCNHSNETLHKFIASVDKLCGKLSLFEAFHKLYHNRSIDEEFRSCIVDGYIFVQMITNIVFDNGITDGYISMEPFNEECVDYTCDLIIWCDQCLWMNVIRNGLYINRMGNRNFNRYIHDKFVKAHGGGLLNVLGSMYVERKNYNLLYDIGMIYGLIYETDTDCFVTRDMVEEVYTSDGEKSYVFKLNDLAFDGNNGIVMLAYDINSNDPSEDGIVAQVIEKQTDGYVYHDIWSEKDMNTSNVVYFSELVDGNYVGPVDEVIDDNPLTSNALTNNANGLSITGGGLYLKGGFKLFNSIEMPDLSQLLTYAVCAAAIVFIVCMIIREYRKTKGLGIKYETNSTAQARVLGGWNPNLPKFLEDW